jgi:UrcA family protein
MNTKIYSERPHDKTLRSLSLALASSAVVMGFIGFAMPVPANAASQATMRQEIVRYSDLDLTKAADAERLRTRIRRAAKHVCSQPGTVGLWLHMQEQRCAEQAHDNAWAEATNAISNRRLAVRAVRN